MNEMDLDLVLGEFCRRMKIRRKNLGAQQQKMAVSMGIDNTMLSRLESGQNWPSVKNLIRICQGLSTSPDYLLGFSDKRAALPPRQYHIVTAPKVVGPRSIEADIDLGLNVNMSRQIIILSNVAPEIIDGYEKIAQRALKKMIDDADTLYIVPEEEMIDGRIHATLYCDESSANDWIKSVIKNAAKK